MIETQSDIEQAVVPGGSAPPAVRTRRSRKKTAREIEAKVAKHLPDALDKALEAAKNLLAKPDSKAHVKAIELILEAAGLKKTGAGMTFNISQNNVNNGGTPREFRSFDAIVRRRAAQQAQQVIDVTPESE